MNVNPQRAQALFLGGLELSDPAARRQWLDRECAGDAALRQRVEALLGAHEAAGGFGEEPSGQPLIAISTIDQPPAARPGTLLAGRYKLLEAIGEGGMGTVWVAEQMEPVRRKVAVKLVKAGMDSRQVLSRFEAERQALALMDHPNIAKVFDGGVSEQGRPFFVMEYVKGVPFTEYCDRARLSLPARLKLFVPVCQAVQHAHQKGIIHRDLKPSNILVCLYDGQPVPKVIDFGLAKAMHQSLTEHTLHTAHGLMVGTPLYMSPEQAELNNLDVDTRTDIYSLGVILYELLTGSTPLEKGQLKAAALNEILRLIKEVEPPKPSTRLSGSASLPSIAAQRGLEPAQLSRAVRGDLDWIVMKALDKERSRRYETANGLARDLERFLNDEAVEACPPSASYRLRKFARKHRAALYTAAAFALLLVLGTAISTWQAIRATQAEGVAQTALLAEASQRRIAEEKQREALQAADKERQARQREAAQRAIAVKERSRAEKARDRTRDVLDAMTSEVTGDSLSTQKEISAEQKKFLTEVLTYYREFAGEKADDEQTRARTANAGIRVGLIELRLSRKEQGLVAFQMARDGYQTLVADFPAVPAYRRELARSHNNLAVLLTQLGKRAEAEEHYRISLAIKENLTADFPTVPHYRQELAISHNGLGALLARLGKRAEAEEQYRRALAIQEKLTVDFPTVPDYRQDLAISHSNLGALLAALGQRAEAEEQYREALAIQEKLAADFPAVPAFRQELAGSHNNLGVLLKGLEKRAEAEQQHRKALAIQEKLAADFPTVLAYQIGLGGSYCNYGILVRPGGRAEESLGWFDRAITTLAQVHCTEPRDVKAKQFLRDSHWGRANTYDALAKHADAVQDWDRAIELSPPAEQSRYRASRAASRMLGGMVAEAVADVAELTKSPSWDARQWYTFACVYAVASGKIADKRQEYADRAMELLQQAVKAGWKDAAHIAKDTDLDLLREREDFKKLLAELEAKPAPPPGQIP